MGVRVTVRVTVRVRVEVRVRVRVRARVRVGVTVRARVIAWRQHSKGGDGADVRHQEVDAERLQRGYSARVRTPRRRRRAVHGRARGGRVAGAARRPCDERRRRLAALSRLVLLECRLVRVRVRDRFRVRARVRVRVRVRVRGRIRVRIRVRVRLCLGFGFGSG